MTTFTFKTRLQWIMIAWGVVAFFSACGELPITQIPDFGRITQFFSTPSNALSGLTSWLADGRIHLEETIRHRCLIALLISQVVIFFVPYRKIFGSLLTVQMLVIIYGLSHWAYWVHYWNNSGP